MRISVPQPDKLKLVIDITPEIYGPKAPANLALAQWVEHTGGYLKNQPFNSQHIKNKYFHIPEPWYHSVEMGMGKREANVHFEFKRGTKKLPPQMWLTMNPRKLGPAGFKTLIAILSDSSGPFSIKPILQSARVTMLDVAVDIVGLQVSDLVIWSQNVGKRQHFVGTDEVLETVNLHRKPYKSKPASNVFLKAYDRRRERLDSGKKPPFGAGNVTRVEVTKRLKKPYNLLAEMCDFKDPFGKSRVGFVCDQMPISKDWLAYHALRRTLTHVTAAKVLSLTPQQKDAFIEAVEVPKNPIVAESLNWIGWKEGLKKTGLFQLVTAAK